MELYAKPFKTPDCIVPVPSGARDRLHAQHFARALGCLLGCEVMDVLVNSQEGPQKAKRLSERPRISISTLEFVKFSGGEKVILVDDVVTSGQTALACWRALGKPLNFEIWSLAERTSLATPSLL